MLVANRTDEVCSGVFRFWSTFLKPGRFATAENKLTPKSDTVLWISIYPSELPKLVIETSNESL